MKTMDVRHNVVSGEVRIALRSIGIIYISPDSIVLFLYKYPVLRSITTAFKYIGLYSHITGISYN